MSAYPENTVRIMRSQMLQIKRTIGHHFARRHDGRGNVVVRNWIAEYRRVDAASGYTEALRKVYP